MNESQAEERREAGRRAAELASENNTIAIEAKPYGQTTPEIYPYTYWWVKGWNDFIGAE